MVSFLKCRSASVAASTAVHAIADEVDSASSDDEEYEARKVKNSSVCEICFA